jgi:hypothetical protein
MILSRPGCIYDNLGDNSSDNTCTVSQKKKRANQRIFSISLFVLGSYFHLFIGHQVRQLSKYPYFVPKIESKNQKHKQQKKVEKENAIVFFFILGSYLPFFTGR